MAYQVHLEQFEGPLDLLLQLIQKARIPIEEIFISEITGEYVRIVGELKEEQLEDASDFVALAAQLLYLKSRRLLPTLPALTEEEEEDPEQAFIRRLEEYQRCKQAAAELQTLYQEGQYHLSKLPVELPTPPVEAFLPDADGDSLFAALLSALKGLPEKEEAPTHRVRRDVYTVRERSGMLRERLRETPSLPFAQLFDTKPSHMELVVTFMAVLELMARGEIRVLQKDTFAPIRLKAVSLSDGDEGSYMDEETELL